jgi:hypothetical protein
MQSRFYPVPATLPIEKGKLYAGEYPGAREPAGARARLLSLVEIGIRAFVDLTGPADNMDSYEGLLAELEEEAGGPLRRLSIPIADMGIPEASASTEGVIPDTGNAVGDRDARQAVTEREGPIPDAGDRFACYNRRYD